MKITKKLFYIILIFAIIQAFNMIFINNQVYADSFFENVFEQGKEFKNMGAGSDNVIDSAGNITNTTQDIYDGIKAIGAVIFFVNIGFMFITLSMKNNGKDIAGAKVTITFTFILAVAFIFADKIMAALQNIFEQFEGLM